MWFFIGCLLLKIVEDLTAAGVNVYVMDIDLSTLDGKGRENPVAKMVLTVLALGAEMERKLILERLNSGRELAKKRGVAMGRPKGTTDDLQQKYPEVVTHLRKGQELDPRDCKAHRGVSFDGSENQEISKLTIE